MPDEIPDKTLDSQDGQLGIAHLLKGAGLVSSTSEAFRMIKQGAVKIDAERVEDRGLQIKAGSTHIYQVGKRKFARVMLA
jgi:tyrosyl-tRNA synthetase